MKKKDIIVLSSIIIFFVILITSLFVFSVGQTNKCKDAGGIPRQGLCLHPSALIRIDE